jgi:glutaconyl-CoA/methylmalonyl-CoA decarboxylase subunit gamma
MKYKIKVDDQTYQVEIIDLNARPIVAIVDGERFEVDLENGLANQPALPAISSSSSPSASPEMQRMSPNVPGATPASKTLVRAPIPGVIVAMLVKPGDTVVYGQDLCTIEAMKMRNNIRAAWPGQIAEILVSTGQTVNHNDVLIRFEEQE